MAMLLKPSRVKRLEAQYERRKARHKSRLATKRALQVVSSQRRKEAYARDGGRDRVTGERVKLVSDNPLLLAHGHHVIFRSAGGSDELWNICTVSPLTHERIHNHEIDVEGNANGTLICRQRNLETGAVIREWESPCPTATEAR